MSTIDRNDFVGRPSRRKPLVGGDYAPPIHFPLVVRDRASEARKGGREIRHSAWIDHKYDCNNGLWGSGRDVKHSQMESCSLYASWHHLWGEQPEAGEKFDEGRFSYSVTDSHW